MNRSAQVASHLAAIALGIAIAASATGFSTRKSAVTASANPEPAKSVMAGKDGTSSSAVKRVKQASMTLKTGDFKMAWDSLPDRELPREERRRIQGQLLERWARVDLQGAMDAAIAQAWDEDGNDPFVENTWLSAFSEAFRERPLEAWALIQGGRYGLAAQMLRRKWLTSVSEHDTALLVSLLPEMSAGLQKEAIAISLSQLNGRSERDATLAKIIAQAGDTHDDWLQAAFRYMPGEKDPAPLRESWATLPAGAERKIAMLKWGASLLLQDADTLHSELSAVPTDAKEAAAEALISQFDEDAPGLLVMVGFATTTDSWGKAPRSSIESVLDNLLYSDQIAPEECAAWGATLPQRADTVEIYQAAITRYISQDLARAKEWLGAMEQGSWQRDNGLAEYARRALMEDEDAGASQWALDSISDPKVKAGVEKWRRHRDLQAKYQ